MIKPLELLNITIKFYSLDNSFNPIISNYNNEYILYVNYFGICDAIVDNVLLRYPSDRVIIDNSQAFFQNRESNVWLHYIPQENFYRYLKVEQ